jgi:hypothetical protein
MSFLRSLSLMRHVSLLSAAVALSLGSASAQVAPFHNSSDEPAASSSESSSSTGILGADNGSSSSSDALPADPAPSGSASGQESGGYGHNYHSHSLTSHLAFEAGGGFNAPTSSSSNDITWGGNFTLGAGYRFTNRISALVEYQFIDSKLPGALIAEAGATGGYDHIWSFSVDPVVDLFPKSTNDVYVTGGGGFYRKVTSFTDPEPTEFCSYFYCGVGYENTVVGHFSSNQGGYNIGGGFQHRLGGMYGEGKAKLFAEVRFLDVQSPAITTSANGLGTTSVGSDTKIIPVTFGVRW